MNELHISDMDGEGSLALTFTGSGMVITVEQTEPAMTIRATIAVTADEIERLHDWLHVRLIEAGRRAPDDVEEPA